MTRLGLRRIPLALVLALALVMGVNSSSQAAYRYAPPTGFKVFEKSNTSITLTWTRTPGLNRYAIQYSTSSSFSNPKYRVPDGVTSQSLAYAAVRDLSPGTIYYFRIRSTYATANASDWSAPIKVATSAYAFAAPSKPTFSNVLNTSVDLKWGEVPNAGKYRIRYSQSSTFASGVYYAYFADNAGTVNVNLLPGKKYYFQVRALEAKADDAGNPYLLTGYSSSSYVTMATTYTIKPPTDLEVVGNSKDKIVLRWTPTPGASGYRIQQTSGSTSRYLNSFQVPIGAGSIQTSGGKVTATLNKWCDSGGTCNTFTPGTKFAFSVSAMSNAAAQISGYSPAVSVVATVLPLVPPNSLALKSTTSGSFTLSWEAVTGATSYRIQEKKGSTSGETRYLYDVCGSSSPVPCLVSGNTVTVTLSEFTSNSQSLSTPLAAKSTYYFKVAAQAPPSFPGTMPDSYDQFDDRASEYTPAYLMATTDEFPLNPPALQSTVRERDAITLGWLKSSDATAYVIDRSKDTVFGMVESSSCLTTTVLGADSLNPAGSTIWQRRYASLGTETTYYFRIRIVNDCTAKVAQSANSATISARTTGGTGRISGKVTAGSNGVNLTNAVSTMTATAYAYQDGQTSSDQEVGGVGRVQSDGSYTIAGLRPGNYRIQLSQIGDKNFTSPWVSSASDSSQWAAESHKFQLLSGIYAMPVSGTVSVPDVPVGVGSTLGGTITRAVGGSAAKDVNVTAIGAPVAPGPLREVRDVTASLSDGSYSFIGLFPGKYKIAFAKSGLRTSSYWVYPVESHPAINVGVCGSAETSCTPTPGPDTYNDAPG